jgi:hypothetical protein
MKATVLDFRRRMKDILHALDNNETVTILYRGKKKGVIFPASYPGRQSKRIADHPAFGIWRDRSDMEDIMAVMEALRKASRHVV